LSKDNFAAKSPFPRGFAQTSASEFAFPHGEL